MRTSKLSGPKTTSISRTIRNYLGESLFGSTSHSQIRESCEDLEKGVLFFHAGVLRRLIRTHKNLSNVAFQVPHTEFYHFEKEQFLSALRMANIGTYRHLSKEADKLPEFIVAIALPPHSELKKFNLEFFNHKYWSYIFHSHIHRQCESLEKKGELDSEKLRHCLSMIGPLAFEEIRDVLQGENYLFDPENNMEVFIEFMAYGLHTMYFYPEHFHRLFPSQEYLDLRDLYLELDLDVKGDLKAAQPQETPMEVDVLEATMHVTLLRGQRLTDFFDRKSRLKRIQTNPKLHHLCGENVESFIKGYQDFMELLIRYIIRDGKNLVGLDFKTIRNLAIREEVDLTAEELFIFDTLFQDEFGSLRLYQRATTWDKLMLKMRSPDAVRADREDEDRKEVTVESVNRFAEELEDLKKNPPGPVKLVFAELFGIIIFVLGGWFFRLYGRLFNLVWSSALKWRDRSKLRLFRENYLRSIQAHEVGNLVSAMLYMQRARAIFENVSQRYETEKAKEVKDKLSAEFSEEIELVAKNFLKETNLEATTKYQTDLSDLLSYLVYKCGVEAESEQEEHLLLDLQSAYVDSRKEFSELNFKGLFLIFGHPMKTPLPHQEKMRRLKHLRSARNRIEKLKLPRHELQRFSKIIIEAHQKTAHQVKELFHPIVEQAFEDVGLAASKSDHQARICMAKIHEEILEVIEERGHSYYTDLRDIISRNDLKIKDVKTGEMFFGDKLIQLDWELGKVLRGVHRPGQIYMRMLQKTSSLFFGTSVGRFMSKHIIGTFGTAYLLVLISFLFFGEKLGWPDLDGNLRFYFYVSIPLGLFIEALIQWEELRRRCWWVLKGVWKLLYGLIVFPFRWLFKLPPRLKNYLIFPALGGGIFFFPLFYNYYQALLYYRPDTWGDLQFFAGIYGLCFWIAFALVNTWVGVLLGGVMADGMTYLVKKVAQGLLLRLFYFIVYLSRTAMQKFEHFLYIVDDYLRFTQGENTLITVAKGLLVLVWLPIAYTATIYIMLFIEPQINPLKFPIVSISYKIIIPFYDKINGGLIALAGYFLPSVVAVAVGGFTAFVFTGIFGFLMWELKENWKLYKHNQPDHVQSVSVGSHGETIPQFLRPGFHSGTIPHIYRSMRYAAHEAEANQNYASVLATEQEEEHVREALDRFVEWDLLHPLREHKKFREGIDKIRLKAKSVSMNTQRISASHSKTLITPNTIQFNIELETWGGRRIEFGVSFEERSGRLIASVLRKDKIREVLRKEQRQILGYFLGVFYKKASIDLVRERVDHYLYKRYPLYKRDENKSISWEIKRGNLQAYLEDNEKKKTTTVQFYLETPHITTSKNDPASEPVDIPQVLFSRVQFHRDEYNLLFEKFDEWHEDADYLRFLGEE